MSKDDEYSCRAIGVAHTSLSDPAATPIQSIFATTSGTVEIYPEFQEGLIALEGFSHIILIYRFHRATGEELSDGRSSTALNRMAYSRPGISTARTGSAYRSSEHLGSKKDRSLSKAPISLIRRRYSISSRTSLRLIVSLTRHQGG